MSKSLRDDLRDLVFKFAGGISNMGDEEIDQILSLIKDRLPEEKDVDGFATPEYRLQAVGWNAYRTELLRRLGL